MPIKPKVKPGRPPGGPSPEPFFIIGCGRSGTTLLQTLIDAHPNIAIPPESDLFEHYRTLASPFGDLRNRRNLERLVTDLLQNRRIRTWGLTTGVQEFCSQLRAPSFHSVVSRVFELYAERTGKKRWGDKTPSHVLYLKQIKRVFPDAKLIHVVRDGRDVAVSRNRVWFGRDSIPGLAGYWIKHVMAFHAFKQQLTPEEFLEVRYEALAEDPERERRRVLEFLGEPYDQGVGRTVPDTVTKRIYQQHDRHFGALNEPISAKRVGQFRAALSRRDLELFESIAGKALRAYGYPLETEGNARPTVLEAIAFFCIHAYWWFRRATKPSIIQKRLWRLLATLHPVRSGG